MIVTCSQCSMSLNFDDARLPNEPFNTVCPRCKQPVTVMPAPKADETLKTATPSAGHTGILSSLTEMLATAIKQANPESHEISKWQRRRILLCLDDQRMLDQIRVGLDKHRYEVFTANTAAEATEILHESRAEAVVLSPAFDPEHQGGATVMQGVNRLTPQARRRLYVVLVSPQLRTLDTYLAFANGVNLTIYPDDVGAFQSIFERSVRDFNEMYRPYYTAASMEAF